MQVFALLILGVDELRDPGVFKDLFVHQYLSFFHTPQISEDSLKTPKVSSFETLVVNLKAGSDCSTSYYYYQVSSCSCELCTTTAITA